MERFRAMEENVRATLGVFSRAKEGGEARQLDGVWAAYSAVDFAMFNAAVLTSPVSAASEFERRIRQAADYFAGRRAPWSVWLCESWLDAPLAGKAGGLLSRIGLRRIADLPGMEADAVTPASRPLPAVECRRVCDERTRQDFNRIMSVAFGVPLPVSTEIYESERAWRGAMAGYVAYDGGAAVSTTAVVAAAEVIGVYAVGTPPAHRRKGYAEAVMRYALERAREESGLTRTMLQSSDAGFRLYRSMGYRPVTRYLVYST